MFKKKKTICLVLNLETPLTNIEKLKDKKYVIYAANIFSINFCLDNNIEFKYIEDLFEKKMISKIELEQKKFFNIKKKNNLKMNLVESLILKNDEYSQQYFLQSYFTGCELAKSRSVNKFKKIIYIGQEFKNNHYFEYYSKNQNKVFFHSFFYFLKNKIKTDIKIQNIKKPFSLNLYIKQYLIKKLFFISENLDRALMFLKSRQISKIKVINKLFVMNSKEQYRFKNFISNSYFLPNTNDLSYNRNFLIKNLFNKNVIFYKYFNQNTELSIIKKIKNDFIKKIKKNKNYNFILHKYYNQYFENRFKTLILNSYNLLETINDKKINHLYCSNLWDFESFAPLFLLKKNYKKNYLIQHASFYPTKYFSSKSIFLYHHNLELISQPKNLKKKKYNFYNADDYHFNKEVNLNLRKKSLLILSQNLPPLNDIIDIYKPKNKFFRDIFFLDKFFNNYKKNWNLYLKLHPNIESDKKLFFLEKYLQNIKIIRNISLNEILKFNRYIELEFPSKIGLNLIKKNKNLLIFKININEKHIKYEKKYYKKLKNINNILFYKSQKNLIEYLN